MRKECNTHEGRRMNADFFGGGGGTKRKRPLGRHGHRWKDNIKIDHRKREWCGMELFIWLTIGTVGRIL
jgi:hypothetical protein